MSSFFGVRGQCQRKQHNQKESFEGRGRKTRTRSERKIKPSTCPNAHCQNATFRTSLLKRSQKRGQAVPVSMGLNMFLCACIPCFLRKVKEKGTQRIEGEGRFSEKTPAWQGQFLRHLTMPILKQRKGVGVAAQAQARGFVSRCDYLF
jgi:hypothetical protein